MQVAAVTSTASAVPCDTNWVDLCGRDVVDNLDWSCVVPARCVCRASDQLDGGVDGGALFYRQTQLLPFVPLRLHPRFSHQARLKRQSCARICARIHNHSGCCRKETLLLVSNCIRCRAETSPLSCFTVLG